MKYYENYYSGSNVGNYLNSPKLITKTYSNYNHLFNNEDDVEKKKRSLLNRAFDVLGTTNYVAAGFAMGLVSDKINPIEGSLQGLWAGLSGLVPFAEGNEKWEYSYSDVLSESGWNPQSTAGKVGKFAVGLGMDIFLDPMTYISGGATGLIKGTGVHSAKGALGFTDKIDDVARGFTATQHTTKTMKMADQTADTLRMTQDVAEGIVKNSTVFKSGMLGDDLVSEATELMNKYNKLIGINDKTADVTFSLANAPFGKKIFGDKSNKVITLVDSDTVKAFGDMTIAPMYGAIRNNVYGTKLTNLFSQNSRLFEIGKKNPEELYNYMKQVQLAKGLSKDKIVTEKLIRTKAKDFFDLTPSQEKEVMDLVQNPSKWQKVEEVMNFFETKEATLFKNNINNAKVATEKELNKVILENDFIKEAFDLSKSEIKSNKEMIEALKKEQASKLLSINERYAVELNNTDEMIKQMKDITNTLDYSAKSPYFDPRHNIISQRRYIKGGIIEPNEELSRHLWKRIDGHIEEKGFIEYIREDFADKMLNKLPGWQKVKEDGVIKLYPPKKQHLIDELSTYLFGQKGFISYKTYDNNIDEIVGMIEKGVDIDVINQHIFDNKDLYSGKASEMYSFIANKVEYKNWFEDYTKPMKELTDKKKKYKLDLDYIKDIRSTNKKQVDEIISKLDYSSLDLDDKTLKKLKIVDGKKQVLINEFKTISDFKNEDLYNEWLQNYMKEFNVINDRKNKIINNTDVVKSIRSKYDNIVKESISNMKRDKQFTLIDEEKMIKLEKMNLKRQMLINEFKDSDTVYDVMNKITELENVFQQRDIDEIINSVYNRYDNGIPLDEAKRLQFTVSDGRDIIADGNPKQYQRLEEAREGIIKPVSSKYKMSDAERVNFIEYVADQLSPNITNIGKAQYRMFNQMSDIAETILRKEWNKTYSSLSDVDMVFLFSEAQERYNKISSGRGHIANDFKEVAEKFTDSIRRNDIVEVLQDGKKVDAVIDSITSTGDKKTFRININGVTSDVSEKLITGKKGKVSPRTLDDIKNADDLFENFSKKQQEVVDFFNQKQSKIDEHFKNIDNLTKEKEILNAKRNAEINNTKKLFEDRTKVLEESTLNIQKELESLQKTFKSNKDFTTNVENLSNKILEYDELLNNNIAFENYVQLNYKEFVDETLNKYNPDVANYILRPNASYDELVRETAIKLKQEFYNMGLEEVNVGKLTKGQLDSMTPNYLPRIATEDGKKLFYKETIDKHIKNFGEEFGYGREYSPHSKSRTIGTFMDEDGIFKNPTIKELNEYFKNQTNGKNVFEEELAEIYLARALKHNDLMYDNEYMQNMVEMFGKPYKGVQEEGYKTIMNYGKLKEFTSEYARIKTSIDVSDYVSEHLRVNEVVPKISTQAMADFRTPKFKGMNVQEIISKRLDEYIDKLTKSEDFIIFKNETNTKHLQEFLNATRTEGWLDDLALPMSEITDEQTKVFNELYTQVKSDYEYHIRSKIGKYLGFGSGEHSLAHQISLDELIERVNYKKEMDIGFSGSVGGKQADRLLNKIDIFNNIKEPQFGLMNDVIVEKANQSRMLQIQRDNSQFLTLYDRFTHLIKVNQTAVLPSFHTRNFMSDTFNNWLSVGQDAVDVNFQKQVYNVMKDAEIDDVLEVTLKNGETTNMKWKDLYKAAVDYKVIDSGLYATEVGSNVAEGMFKSIPSKYDPTDTRNFIGYKLGTQVGQRVENHSRFVHFASQVKNGMSYEEALEMVNKFNFDYSDLTFFEQSVMKRIFPYYTWIRKNAPLQLEMLLEKPDKYRMIGKVIGGVESMVDEDDRVDRRYLSDFAYDWVQTPFTTNDGRVVMANPNLPYQDLNMIPLATTPSDYARDLFSQSNPLIRIPIEQTLNKNMFFDSPITKPSQTTGQKVSSRVNHIASQFGVVPVVSGMMNKSGIDRGFHLLNSTTGLKLSAYDYDKFKAMKLKQIENKKSNSNSNEGIMDSIRRKLR